MLNISGIISKFIKNSSQRDIAELKKIVEKINSWEVKIRKMPDKSFPDKTLEFKSRVQKGADLEDLIPEAFACVREASRRVLSERHFLLTNLNKQVRLIPKFFLHQFSFQQFFLGEG